MNAAALIERFRTADLNPVVVKELRQSVRNWLVIGMLMVMLLILFVTMCVNVLSVSLGTNNSPELGRTIFMIFFSILSFGTALTIPTYVGTRLARENEDSNVDLMFITTLSPARIIRGKILCGVILTGLCFSVFMPFMAFTYLLRGIDLPTMFVALVMSFVFITALIHISILLACLPVSRNFKVGIGVGLFFFTTSWVGGVTIAGTFFFSTGVGSTLGSWNFWGPALTFLTYAAIVMRISYVLAVALVSPPSANRALPVRANLTACLLVGIGLPLVWDLYGSARDATVGAAIVGLVFVAFCLVVSVSSSDHLSNRVCRTIPKSPLGRAVAFVFYSGAAGGVVWTLLLALIVGCVGVYAFDSRIGRMTPSPRIGSDLIGFCSIALYIFDYGLTGLFLHRRFFPKRSGRLAGIFAVALPILLSIVPTLGLFFLNRFNTTSLEGFMPGNVFNVFSSGTTNHAFNHLVSAAFWFLVALVMNAPWFNRQFAAFTRPAPDAAPPANGPTIPPVLA